MDGATLAGGECLLRIGAVEHVEIRDLRVLVAGHAEDLTLLDGERLSRARRNHELVDLLP